MAIVISGTGIDMGNNPVSNVSIVDSASVVDKAYVDDLKIIATGTATFTATTNNINLTGIGIGVEVGDVIQISGAIDVKNNSEFTVEVITDANNIIVNQSHSNKGTSKNVATRASDTGVTAKLLSKWYNAPIGLGQNWVSVTSERAVGVIYNNTTGKPIEITIVSNIGNSAIYLILLIDGVIVDSQRVDSAVNIVVSVKATIPNGSSYQLSSASGIDSWNELR